MTRKMLYTLLLMAASFALLAGCSSKKKAAIQDHGSDTKAKEFLTSSFDKFNKEDIRELTISNSDGSTETTYTWNKEWNAFLETNITSDTQNNAASTSRIIAQEDGTNYVYYQDDAFLENGIINENAGFKRAKDSKNDFKFCENILTLVLTDSALVSKAKDSTIDDIACSKIEVKDPTNGDIIYWVDKKTGYPVQYQTETQITTYRYSETYCMAFEVPSNYTEE